MLGTKRAFLLLALAVLASRFFQQTVGPSIHDKDGFVWGILSLLSGRIRTSVLYGWTASCEEYEYDRKLSASCVGKGGALRPLFVATLFFTFHAIATEKIPLLHPIAWREKYAAFSLALILSIFIPTHPLFDGLLLFIARCGAALYMMLLQPFFLTDIAFMWHQDWLVRSQNSSEGNIWSQGLSILSALFYAYALLAIILLFYDFGNCLSNTLVVSLTFLGVCLMAAFQITRKASIFTSSVLSLYIVYMAFRMVINSPDQSCNPLHSRDGSSLTVFCSELFLATLCFSWIVQKLKLRPSEAPVNSNHSVLGDLEVPFLDPIPRSMHSSPDQGSDVWKLNAVLALLSCWFAMTLTGWGIMTGVSSSGNVVSPANNKGLMTILGAGQWAAIFWYMVISYLRHHGGEP